MLLEYSTEYCREWGEDGRLVAEDCYQYGVRVTGKLWDASGHLIEEYEIEERDPAFQVLQTFRESNEQDRPKDKE